MQPWGRLATLGLGAAAFAGGQIVALAVLTWWYGAGLANLPDFAQDGTAISLFIIVSAPVQVALLMLFASRTGGSATNYLGLVLPRRGEVLVAIAATAALIAIEDGLSSLSGHAIVPKFQSDLYQSAGAAGSLPLLWLAIVVVTPIGEETLFRGFLFRGWLRSPHDVWPVIVVTALIWAMLHVQYDWFVMSQEFALGVLLGWLRWATGSTVLTMLLHGLVNIEAMIETIVALHR
jgi:CAAX protease family protein